MRKADVRARYVTGMKQKYREAKKKEKSALLDEFVMVTGYHRKHAMEVLSGRFKPREKRIRRWRGRAYTDEDKRSLLQLAEWFDEIGSKRLRAGLDQELDRIRAQGHLEITGESFERLKHMSPATMDRLRSGERRLKRKTQGGTKPGSLLKKQIPIRTFAEWDDKKVGFMEMDLVQHDGGNPSGFFGCTLHMTDVCSGWCEPIAIENKAQARVFDALKKVRLRLPFPLIGIDSDNGSEFINSQMLRYSKQEKITFTRGRPGRKNDNPFIEQKNWSVVRRLVGYGRFDSLEQIKALNALYDKYRLFANFFLPVSKLISKQRTGSRVKKIYDKPSTPFQRLLASPDVSDTHKKRLRDAYAKLDVIALKCEIDVLIDKLKPSPLLS
jgi:hypothetical protein